MPKRPSNIQFANAEMPPAASIGILAVQHSAIVLINLVYIVIITKALKLDGASQLAVMSTTLLVAGLGTILQARFGSGLLIVFHPNPIYIPLVIAAGLSYGASGIAVLVASAGLCQFVFGSAVRKLRVLFPPEVCGVVVIMLGVSLLPGTMRGIVEGTPGHVADVIDYEGLVIAVITLAVASACSVWLKGTARFFSLLLGCITGLAVAYFTNHWEAGREVHAFSGVVSESYIAWHLQQQAMAVPAPVFALPGLHFPGFTFDVGLLSIAAVAALVNVVDELGVLIGTERLEDADWRKPDFDKVSRGLQSSGLFTLVSGLLGGVALGMSSANLSLAYATGVTSRVIAMAAGAVLAVVAFLPFLLGFVLSMPDAVLAGLLFYSAAYFIVSGAELALSRMMSPRRALVIGLSVGVGVIIQAIPALAQQASGTSLEHVLTPMTLATLVAIALNLIMRIGITQSETVKIARGDTGEAVTETLEKLGESWGLHRATVARASTALSEMAELFSGMADGPVSCTFEHNELYLFTTFRYSGRPVAVPERAPTAEELMNDPDGVSQMSGWIIKKLSDQATVASKDKVQEVRLAFEC